MHLSKMGNQEEVLCCIILDNGESRGGIMLYNPRQDRTTLAALPQQEAEKPKNDNNKRLYSGV